MTEPSIHIRRLQSRLARTGGRLLDHARRHQLGVDELADARLPWYAIRNEAGDPDVDDGAATVLLFDEIGGSMGVQAEEFVRELEAITAPRINLRINSPGGSVFDAITIHSALLHHSATVRTYVDGLAASAASVIAMGADPLDERADVGGVVMMPGSQLMIHDASALQDGNAAEHGKMQTHLDRQSDNIAGFYRRRGGGEVAEWRELMLAETWMFAEEAVTMGLADRVDASAAPLDGEPELQERMARSFDLGQYGYRHAGRRAAPTPRRRAATAAGPRRTAGGALVRQRSAPGPAGEDRGARLAAAASARRAAAHLAEPGSRAAGYRTLSQRSAGGPSTPPGSERRAVAFPATLRAERVNRDGRELAHLSGHASVVERAYPMWDDFGEYDEVVDASAFDVTLAARPDVAFLVNHKGVTMARTTNETLELAMDTLGLVTDAYLNPKRQDVSDLVIAVEDRNVTEMSFAFLLEGGYWSDDFTTFRIMRANLDRGDVSAVNYGANPATDIAARQQQVLRDLKDMSPALARAAVAQLMRRADLDLDDLYDQVSAVQDTVQEQTPAGRHAATSAAGSTEQRGAGRTISHIEALLLED